MPNAHGRTSKSTTGRRRGGQPGNKNGLRHGFYSHLYTIEEEKELRDSSIEDEQSIARFKARRFAELTPLKNPTERELAIFDRFNAILITINTIERTRLLARGHGGEIEDEIWKAIMELNPYEEL